MKMKKLLGILISFALMMGLLPGVSLMAHAESAYANYVPTASDSATALAGKIVHFNNYDWYIIKDSSTSANAGTVTLLAVNPITASPFDSVTNAYAHSTVRVILDGMTNEGNHSANVSGAINSVNLTDVNVSNAKLYLLSEEEAESLPRNIRKCSEAANSVYNYWWLRTADSKTQTVQSTPLAMYVDADDGNVENATGEEIGKRLGVRPALQLNLSKVTFDSNTNTFLVITDYNLAVGVENVKSDKLSGNGWSFTPATAGNPATLTLNGVNIHNRIPGINYYGTEPLNIVLQAGSENIINEVYFGIYCNTNALLTVSGSGTLNISSKDESGYGIKAANGVIFEGGIVNTSGKYGIKGSQVTINGGTVTAKGTEKAIDSSAITIGNDLKIKAGSSKDDAQIVDQYNNQKWVKIGEQVTRNVHFFVKNGAWNDGIKNGRTASMTGFADETILTADMIPEIGSKPDSGYKEGSWDVTPVAGTLITKNTDYTYTYEQNVPAVPKAPTAKTPTNTGSAQEPVTAGETSGGTKQYASGTDASPAAAPTATPKPKKVPKTGDSAPLALWLGLILVGLIGIGGTLVWKAKKKQ